jgi:hypothetical protein
MKRDDYWRDVIDAQLAQQQYQRLGDVTIQQSKSCRRFRGTARNLQAEVRLV